MDTAGSAFAVASALADEVTMTGDTKSTDVTLREYVELRIASAREYVDTHIAYMREAVELASKTLAEKLASINTTAFVTKVEFQERLQRIDESMKELQLDKARLAGKADQRSVTVATIMSAIGLVLGIVGIILSLTSGG